MTRVKAAQVAYVQALSGYELLALSTGVVPPLTRIAWRYRHQATGRTVILLHLAWLTYHLLWEQE